MFNSKIKPQKTASAYSVVKNHVSGFVKEGMKTSAETRSGNNAKKYSHTDDPFVTQFGSVGQYKVKRSFDEISKDCEILWAKDKRLSIVFMVYLRIITRIVVFFNGISTKVAQKGAELKHESIMRMIWLYLKNESSFWKNIGLFISVGSWKDIFTMLQYDYMYHGWNNRVLDWNKVTDLILTGLENNNTTNLIKKYLPQIKARSKCTTIEAEADTYIAKFICHRLFGTNESLRMTNYKKYRKMKSSGTAHSWQQLISQKKFDRIDFNKIHGRALSLLVRSKFLKNHDLVDKYNAWIGDPKTKEVKYTGFVHDLFQPCKKYGSLVAMPQHEQTTINKQFDTLVKKAGEKSMTKYIVVRDTSGSMEITAKGTNMSSGDIAKAIALYFSEFLTGSFANAWIEFNRDAKMHYWEGDSILEKWYNDHSSYVGNTNFLSVIYLFARIKASGISEDEFPEGILCISDGEFNRTQLDDTNVKASKDILLQAGFSKEYVDNFVIVLWNIPNEFYYNSNTKFETYEGSYPNVFYFGGYSASVISFLSDKVKTARELFDAAMDQEVLNMVEL
jgi:hypothetical protein